MTMTLYYIKLRLPLKILLFLGKCSVKENPFINFFKLKIIFLI